MSAPPTYRARLDELLAHARKLFPGDHRLHLAVGLHDVGPEALAAVEAEARLEPGYYIITSDDGSYIAAFGRSEVQP